MNIRTNPPKVTKEGLELIAFGMGDDETRVEYSPQQSTPNYIHYERGDD